MSLNKWNGLLASCAFAGVLAVVSGGCSSSTGTTTTDGGGDDSAGANGDASHPPPIRHVDGSPDNPDTGTPVDDSGPEGSTGGVDGTTGKQCAMDSDCSQDPTNPNTNKCTIAGFFANGPIFATPVCLPTILCPTHTDNLVHFCDGPDVQTSPGICLPLPASAGGGEVCYPQCTILSDGSAPIGCHGHDVCIPFVSGLTTNGLPIALGFCDGGCTADGDCPSGSVCQKNDGHCVTTAVTPTKQLGQTCTGNDPAGACSCFSRPSTGIGYCTLTTQSK